MTNIETLCRDWIEAKKAEAAANRQRLAIEPQIGAALESKTEGSITHTLEEYKVTLTQPVTRKIDLDQWALVKGLIPAEFWPIKTKTEADVVGIKYLMKNSPDVWAKIAPAFETKPAKLAVKCEEL